MHACTHVFSCVASVASSSKASRHKYTIVERHTTSCKSMYVFTYVCVISSIYMKYACMCVCMYVFSCLASSSKASRHHYTIVRHTTSGKSVYACMCYMCIVQYACMYVCMCVFGCVYKLLQSLPPQIYDRQTSRDQLQIYVCIYVYMRYMQLYIHTYKHTNIDTCMNACLQAKY
jgi:hypothetical protein